jgi:hypothetical protein
MSSPILKRGAKGPYVTELQTLLESKLKPADRNHLGSSGHLEITGYFGDDTEGCVIDFQIAAFLDKDGIVGPLTWRALRGEETYNAYQATERAPCPNSYHCWAACTGMLKGLNYMDKFKVPNVDFESFGNNQIGGLGNEPSNVAKFAAWHGFDLKQAAGWTCDELCRYALHYGRLALNIRGVAPDLKKSPDPNDSHWVILVGVRGDGTPKGTSLYMINPSATGGDWQIVHTYKYLKWLMPQLTHMVMYKVGNHSSPIY